MGVKDYEFRRKKFTTEFYSGDRAGIRIEVNHQHKFIDISGWYDSMVGIEAVQLSIKEFCKQMGITKEDLE